MKSTYLYPVMQSIFLKVCKSWYLYAWVLFLLSSCGYGQAPVLKVNDKGKIYNANRPKDSIVLFNQNRDEREIEKEPASDPGFYRDTLNVETLIIDTTQNGKIKRISPKILYGIAGIQFDSGLYYYHQFLKFNKKMQDPKTTIKKMGEYEDSCKKYLYLLNKYNLKENS